MGPGFESQRDHKQQKALSEIDEAFKILNYCQKVLTHSSAKFK